MLEYKFFEPAFYHTDVPDWGTSYAQVAALGERAMVCLDTGHHAPGTNIEFIVAQLLRLGKLGSFDFNSRFYADDDLIVGAADPFQLFRILVEVVRGGGYGPDSEVALMLDQCHNIEAKVPGQIRSVLNVQEMLAARAAPRHRRARRGTDAPVTCWRPTRSSWTPSTPTYAATWRPGARSAACPRTRCGPTSRAATSSRSRTSGSAARRRPGLDLSTRS